MKFVLARSILAWSIAGFLAFANASEVDISKCIMLLKATGGEAFHAGSEVPIKLKRKLDPKSKKIYLLGEGAEARVYRVHLNDGSSYILRDHTVDPEEHPVADYLAGLRFLEEIEGNIGFKIQKVNKEIKPGLVQLEDVRGFSLEELILKYGENSQISKKLLALYYERIKLLANQAKRKFGKKVTYSQILSDKKTSLMDKAWFLDSTEAVPGSDPTENRKIGLILSPRNVIVDLATLEMTIIDSF